VVVLAVALVRVVIPLVLKVPVMVVFPDAKVPAVERFPAVTCPETPTPPVTIMDPVPVVVLAVPLVKLEIPEKVGVVVVAMTPEVIVMLVPAV